MSPQPEFSVARWLARVLVCGSLLGVLLYLVYLAVAILRA